MSPMSHEPAARADDAAADASVLDFAAVLLRRWKVIAASTLLFTALAALAAYTMPRTYTSRVVLVPSSGGGSDSRFQLLASQLQVPGLAAGVARAGNPGMVTAIVKSQAVRDSVRVRLAADGGPAPDRALLAAALKSVAVETDPVDRSVKVDVVARDPRLAQRVAKQFPQAVNAIATSVAIQTAENRAETVQRQLAIAQANLQRSQRALTEYQQRTGTPAIQEQARQSVAAAGDLQREIAQQQVVVAGLRASSTPENPEYRAAVRRLNALRGQLSQLTQGGELFPSRSALPAVQMELARRMREFEKDQQIYLTLTGELVDAQMNLREDLAVVSVLDAPALPDAPSGPRRGLLIVLGVMLGGVIGLFLAYAADYVAGMRRTRPDEPFFVEWDRLRGAGRRAPNGRGVAVP